MNTIDLLSWIKPFHFWITSLSHESTPKSSLRLNNFWTKMQKAKVGTGCFTIAVHPEQSSRLNLL
jgi:hypothetical protein